MARPRIFISSSYYDLRHIRTSLETFVQSLGYEPVLSEKGDIAYAPDRPLDDSCYREAAAADMLVLIIGGRYGTEKSESRTGSPHAFFDRYDSITKLEFDNAVKNNVPVWILVDAQVYAEYQTFQRNKDAEDIAYAHVDSVNIFHLIESILTLRQNNALFAFSRYTEIEGWLREQWAGIFRDFLKRNAQSQQLTSLSAQVAELAEINKTLKTYMESLMRAEPREQVEKVIKEESVRLNEVEQRARLEADTVFAFLKRRSDYESAERTFRQPDDINQFFDLTDKIEPLFRKTATEHLEAALGQINQIRDILGRPHFEPPLPEKAVSGSDGPKSRRARRPSGDAVAP
jgi:hypothetical protein